jgi:hypothetical protein
MVFQAFSAAPTACCCCCTHGKTPVSQPGVHTFLSKEKKFGPSTRLLSET